MPQFAFKVEDQSGRIRTGRIAADDLQAARERMSALGMKILSLTAAPSEPTLRSAPKTVGVRIRPAEPYDPSIQWDIRWIEFWSRRPAGSFNAVLMSILALLFGAGLSYFILTSRTSVRAQNRNSTQPPEFSVNMTITGSVTMDGPQDLGDVTLVLDLPEVPCQFGKAWKDLEHPSAGRFKWDLAVKTRVLPKKCNVTAKKPHYRSDSATQPLTTLEAASVSVQLHLKAH
jgi:hypothetical protein